MRVVPTHDGFFRKKPGLADDLRSPLPLRKEDLTLLVRRAPTPLGAALVPPWPGSSNDPEEALWLAAGSTRQNLVATCVAVVFLTFACVKWPPLIGYVGSGRGPFAGYLRYAYPLFLSLGKKGAVMILP